MPPRVRGARARTRRPALAQKIVKANTAAREFNVRSVTDEQGRPLPFDHDMGGLVVGLLALASPQVLSSGHGAIAMAAVVLFLKRAE